MEWQGWPDGKRFAIVLTHDIESQIGHDKCGHLMDLEQSLGFRSSLNFVAELYKVSPELRKQIAERGFEAGLHGITHDGKLYKSRAHFINQADKLNRYIREWKVAGFRSPAVQYNLDWLRDLDIIYDASTFDIDPFQPQPGGLGRIFPAWVPPARGRNGYVELPYTLPQDCTLFSEMRQKDIQIWVKKLDWIAERGGMALLITHPDYMDFGNSPRGCAEYPVRFYEEFLHYIKSRYEGQYWQVLPREMAAFWSDRQKGLREQQGDNLDSLTFTFTGKLVTGKQPKER